MRRKPVKSLLETSLSCVGKKIFDTIQHLLQDNCQICVFPTQISKCSILRSIKAELELPPNILNALFDNIVSNSRIEENTFPENGSTLLHIYCFLLESSDLQVHFGLIHGDDEETLFMAVYGKYIHFLSISDDVVRQYYYMWKTILYSVRNLQTLSLCKCHVNNSLLEAIGQSCEQIKNIHFLEIHEDMTMDAATKLCVIENGNKVIKTKCCDSLQYIDIRNDQYYPAQVETFQKTCNFITILLENMPNLKSLGSDIYFDTYIQTLTPVKLISLSTCLEEIVIVSATKGLFCKLKPVCPKLKMLEITGKCCDDVPELQKNFPLLQNLSCRDCATVNIYKVVTNSIWSHLTNLCARFSDSQIELSDFAKYLPVLEKLDITECRSVKWNGKTCFQFLYDFNAYLYSCFKNMSWICSFSKTVKILSVCGPYEGRFKQDSCKDLLTAPLPQLEDLNIPTLICDYNFVTSIVMACPSLKQMYVCNLKNKEEWPAVTDFLEKNNYDCCAGQSGFEDSDVDE